MGCETSQRARVEPLAGRREKQRVVRAAGELRAGVAQVARQAIRCLFAEGDHAVLAALAVADVHELLLEVDVAEIERDRFRAAQAGGVDELDERAVPQRERAVTLER